MHRPTVGGSNLKLSQYVGAVGRRTLVLRSRALGGALLPRMNSVSSSRPRSLTWGWCGFVRSGVIVKKCLDGGAQPGPRRRESRRWVAAARGCCKSYKVVSWAGPRRLGRTARAAEAGTRRPGRAGAGAGCSVSAGYNTSTASRNWRTCVTTDRVAALRQGNISPLTGCFEGFPTCQYTMLGARSVPDLCIIRRTL